MNIFRAKLALSHKGETREYLESAISRITKEFSVMAKREALTLKEADSSSSFPRSL